MKNIFVEPIFVGIVFIISGVIGFFKKNMRWRSAPFEDRVVLSPRTEKILRRVISVISIVSGIATIIFRDQIRIN